MKAEISEDPKVICPACGTTFALDKDHCILSCSEIAGLQKRVEWLEKSLMGFYPALASMVDHKDKYTHNHSVRVADVSVAIGIEMGLDQKALKQLRGAAKFHDIGKIHIPLEIIQKQDSLTPEEYEIIKEHPKKGAEILRHIESYSNISDIVLHHHEHYDGSGYPDGLRGEEIPLLSRIITVADCFDALAVHRHYRDAKSFQQIYVELRKHSGTQFDPAVVEAALKIDFIEHVIE